jgi:hypothetical protein
MVLNKYRGNVQSILTPIANLFSGLHPNTISAVSLLFAFLAGYIQPWLLHLYYACVSERLRIPQRIS